MNNLVYTGSVDWCTTVRTAPDAKVKNVAVGQPWGGTADPNAAFGSFDPTDKWHGWLTATDADTGKVRWKSESPAPILAAVTPTAGRIVFFGDMEGNLYALDADAGKQQWTTKLEGALGGGIIIYSDDERQLVAVTYGMQSPIWPAPKTTAKIVVFGL